MSAEDWIEWDFDWDDDLRDEAEELTDIKIIYVTDKAVLIQHKNRKAWFPKIIILHLDDEIITYDYNFNPTWQTMIMKPIEGDFI